MAEEPQMSISHQVRKWRTTSVPLTSTFDMWRVYGILKILRLKGHVIQRMRNPKIAMVRYVTLHVHCTATRPTYDIESISETTTPINMKFQDNIWTTKMCPAVQYVTS